jgi:hypothetical protein
LPGKILKLSLIHTVAMLQSTNDLNTKASVGISLNRGPAVSLPFPATGEVWGELQANSATIIRTGK